MVSEFIKANNLEEFVELVKLEGDKFIEASPFMNNISHRAWYCMGDGPVSRYKFGAYFMSMSTSGIPIVFSETYAEGHIFNTESLGGY